MPVTHVDTDVERHTLTITAEFAAPARRVWAIYEDPRQLERVFGPRAYPTTFVAHSLTPGGRMHYFMTSPEGEKHPGWWLVSAVDAPHSFQFEDGFAQNAEDFTPDDAMPATHNDYRFEELGDGRTRATFTSVYATAEAIQQILDMGAVQGTTETMSQIDDLLAAA